MKDYTADFFTYFGCTLHQDGNVLSVELTPELAQHFGKSTLRLVFHPEHLEEQAELVTHGSYIINRIYDLLKFSGEKVSVTLPKRQKTKARKELSTSDLLPTGINCVITKQRSREIRKTDVYIIFRITYYSDEKIEEMIIVGMDFERNLQVNTEFPYPPEILKDAVSSRFPFTRKQTQEIYDRCLEQASIYAEKQALKHQEKLGEHFHESITRLEAYYQQMIEEVPVLEENREDYIRQLQDEYEIKTADELKNCQVQVSIAPISFCTITIPFRRYRYTFRTSELESKGYRAKSKRQAQAALNRSFPSVHVSPEVTVDIYHNLFSGELIYPRCESCGREMKQIGVCEVNSHLVCHNCLVECHECGTHLCRDCGIEVCFECGEWVCHQCSKQCHICGERYCTRHLQGCLICREHFCLQCAETCEVCGKPVGKIHLTACEISYKLVCPACMSVCSCCRKQVCQSFISFCAFCGQQACAECTFRCEVCGEAFCVHHILECEVTKKMVCPRHSGVCESCSRHVSTENLNTCDVCGKKVCTLCSTQCHHCGNFFCEAHAGEMMRCPECGELYCTLCYSGRGLCVACRKGNRVAGRRVTG
jgi:hypothetical protein